MQTRNPRKRLMLAVTVALLAPGLAFGQTAKEKELEARIAQLEAQVQALLSAQQQQQASIAQTQTQLDEVKVAQAPAADGKPKIQSTPILTAGNPNSTFSYGGFIKFDGMLTDTSDGAIADGSSGRLFYVPSTIPVVANGAEPDSDPYTDFHAQFSRFWLSADHVTDNGDKLKGYVEMDFFGGGSNALAGNEVATNTYAVTLRQAYVSWNNWLAGQTWSNFQDTAALPDAVDFVGVTEGATFVRQAQIRYTKGGFSVSAENPQTTVNTIATAARTNGTGSNTMPDLTARWVTKGKWGHFSAAGLLRQFKAGDETASGAAVSLSGKFNLGDSDDIRWMANYGDGLGRYMAFGLGPDTALDANGELHAVTGMGGFVAWRHVIGPKLRSNLMYSMAAFDNDKDLAGWNLLSEAATERASSIHANLIYSPLPKLDVGVEIGYGKRELEDSREGDLKRVQATVKYSF
ncbi:MAG: DcaP family trimeric outer membrane transporter [Thermomonas sp.]|uniref:DcaP family trimeric outer membrane transporter n=1 Tax=Thermomonas sp. TaxID=1971895 RepID=UPI0039E6A034